MALISSKRQCKLVCKCFEVVVEADEKKVMANPGFGGFLTCPSCAFLATEQLIPLLDHHEHHENASTKFLPAS